MILVKDLARHYITHVETILNLRETCRYYRDAFPWDEIRHWKCRGHSQVRHITSFLKWVDCVTIEIYVQWSFRHIKPRVNPCLQLSHHKEIFASIVRPWLNSQEHKYKRLLGSNIAMQYCKRWFTVYTQDKYHRKIATLMTIKYDGTIILHSVFQLEEPPTVYDLIRFWQTKYPINRMVLVYFFFIASHLSQRAQIWFLTAATRTQPVDSL